MSSACSPCSVNKISQACPTWKVYCKLPLAARSARLATNKCLSDGSEAARRAYAPLRGRVVDQLSASVGARLVLGKLRKLGERTGLSVFIQNSDIGHSGFDLRPDPIEGFSGAVALLHEFLD